MPTHHIYGDYGLVSETELECIEGKYSRSIAIEWAKRYCRRDMGGYSEISVVHFAPDGEVITDWRLCADDRA